MIELDKKDIEGIGRRRYINQHWKKLYGVMFGWIAIVIVAMLAMRPSEEEIALHGESWVDPTIIVVGVVLFAGFIGWMYSWSRAENRAVAAFKQEVEEHPVLSYKPEPIKNE